MFFGKPLFFFINIFDYFFNGKIILMFFSKGNPCIFYEYFSGIFLYVVNPYTSYISQFLLSLLCLFLAKPGCEEYDQPDGRYYSIHPGNIDDCHLFLVHFYQEKKSISTQCQWKHHTLSTSFLNTSVLYPYRKKRQSQKAKHILLEQKCSTLAPIAIGN